MPRYRTQLGVVVNIPAEKAARIDGLRLVDAAPPAPRKAPRQRRASNRRGADTAGSSEG